MQLLSAISSTLIKGKEEVDVEVEEKNSGSGESPGEMIVIMSTATLLGVSNPPLAAGCSFYLYAPAPGTTDFAI